MMDDSASYPDLERTIEQVETALMRGDLQRAAAIIEASGWTVADGNQRFRELVHRVRQALDGRENIQSTLEIAEHLLANDDPDQALRLFQKILDVSPDHRAARAGIQDARRKIDHRHSINVLIEKVRKSREDSDFGAAREYCREWLQLAPGDEQAASILQAVERSLKRSREVRVILNRGRELIDMARYQDAVDCLEGIHDLDPDCDTGLELIREAMKKMAQLDQIAMNKNIIDEVQRLIARGHFQQALKKLDSLEDVDGEFETDMQLLRRKSESGLLDRNTEETLRQRLLAALDSRDLEAARVWLDMIVNLNPATDVFDRLRREMDPNDYDNLTR
ncbi:MAG TPA: tetratricopeptide repeat protein [bacterium]|nr:tetratricopeptide repeat protein [bacterium]